MSDPVKNVNIEEVLSSIKKLVTVDQARLTPFHDISAPDTDKLILTSDLRVVKDDEPAAIADPLVLSPDVANSANAESRAQTLTFLADSAPDRVETDDVGTLETRIAGLEAAVAAQSDDFEPDGSETPAGRTVSVLPRRVHLSVPEGADVGAGEEAAEKSVVDFHRAETGAGQVEQQPDRAAGEPELADGSEPAPREADPVRFGTFDGVEDADPLEQTDFLEDSDVVLDEVALREIVADIVRQELQGALGERITRNVRKLVRREIMRANSVRDFE